MKLSSVSGLVCYVTDIAVTAQFYDKLGFIIIKRQPDHLSIRLNWFWIDFHPRHKADIPAFQQAAARAGSDGPPFIYVRVVAIDDYYRRVVADGLQPAGEPQDYPWGNREFLLPDPDGYKLVFFEPK